jgi:cytochrome c peroxidase
MLSSDNTVACASCHKQEYSFSDNQQFSIGVKGRKGRRNSMHLLNLIFDKRFFWDGRAASLEEQVLMPIEDNNEMDLPLEELIERLQYHPIYPNLFERAYGKREVSKELIADALAQFVKSIVSYSSPEDYFRALDAHYISIKDIPKDILRQYPLYKSSVMIQNCGACHSIALETGQNLFEDVGLEMQPEDEGYFIVTKKEIDKGKFKTPVFRNIAVTAPYMHDGRFPDLKSVLDHYRQGMKIKPNLSPLYMTSTGGIRTKLITDKEANLLLEALQLTTDRLVLSDPKYSNPF